MGKIFIAGLFLGAAAASGGWYWKLTTLPSEEQMAEREKGARVAGALKAEQRAKEEHQKKRDELKETLQQEAKARQDELTEQVEGLKEQIEKLKAGLADEQKNVRSLKDDKVIMQARIDAVKKDLGKLSDAPRGLLMKRVDLMPVQLRLWSRLSELAAVFDQALLGWPNVKRARSAAEDLEELSKEITKLSEGVQVFIQQRSRELGEALGGLDRYRAGIRGDELKEMKGLIKKFAEAAKSFKAHSVTVEAASANWTYTDVSVEAGDLVHLRAAGRWRMHPNWGPAGPEGWDGGGQYKFSQEARAGAVIVRIGFSETPLPAYLGRPIKAEGEGRVMVRINDKEVKDNVGKMKVDAASINPKVVEGALSLWREVSPKFVR